MNGWREGGGVGVDFVVKQKTAYEMRISDWSSDVCSSDLRDLATTEPSVNGLAVSADAIGIFLEGDLAIMLARDVSCPDRACRAKSAPLKQAVDHRGVEAVLLGRRPPFGVQAVRYSLRRRPVGSVLGNPGEEFDEVLQLPEP